MCTYSANLQGFEVLFMPHKGERYRYVHYRRLTPGCTVMSTLYHAIIHALIVDEQSRNCTRWIRVNNHRMYSLWIRWNEQWMCTLDPWIRQHEWWMTLWIRQHEWWWMTSWIRQHDWWMTHWIRQHEWSWMTSWIRQHEWWMTCLLYTSDAADES